MISKIIPPGKSFPGLCRYLYQNKSRAEVILSAGVRDYDHSKMAADFAVQAAQNPRLKSPVLHIILSWSPEEKVDQELMSNIAKDYLERMNIIDTQFAVIKHNDRDHQHVHLVVNRVDNNGRTVKDNYIGLKGKKVAQQLTLKYGLKVAAKKDLSHSHLERLNGYDAQRYQLFTIIHDLLPYCKNFEELERRLSQHKIAIQYKYKGQTKEIQGISFCKGELKFKGSDLDRSFSYLKLQKLFASQSHQLSVYKREKLRMKIEPENLGQYNHAAKLLYELLKPEFTPDFVPYELTRKKKQNRSLGH